MSYLNNLLIDAEKIFGHINIKNLTASQIKLTGQALIKELRRLKAAEDECKKRQTDHDGINYV